MGGNALKNCKTRRYQADEYDNITIEIAHILISNGITCTRIPSYFDKESFGDLDMLVKSETLPTNWVDKIVEWFNPKEYFKNGNVLSFEYKEFQIDLVVTPEKNWLSSFYYFAFNDLGNLVGRIAHNMGLKLGHDGLSYCGRVDTYKFKELVLLKDWKDILPVLGLSYERYKQGFKTLDEMFEFVVSSPFFYKDIYLLQNRNHVSRVRDAKRKTYNAFLTWIEDYEETDEQNLVKAVCVANTNKSVHLAYLFEKVEGFKEQYEQTQKEYEQELEFRERFNGNRVKSLSGLEGKELGEFMKWIKIEKTEERLRKDVLAMNPVLIDRWITYYVDKWKQELPLSH